MVGPLVGGLIMGLLETIGSIYLGAGLKDAIPFALLIIFFNNPPTRVIWERILLI